MTAVLDIAIGLGFVFLVFSLVASTIVEWGSAVRDRRARSLKLALRDILGAELTSELLGHPVIRGIAPPRPRSWRRSLPEPSYLPRKAVALALADMARQSASAPLQAAQSRLHRLMRTLKSELVPAGSNQNLAIDAEVLFRVEHWFDEQMARTTSAYKRWTQLGTLVVALSLTVGFDIDAGRIARRLFSDAAVRSALAATASAEVVERTLAQVQAEPAAGTIGELPIGWTRSLSEALAGGVEGALATLAGWAISIIAIGLGAPFWFDLLNRLVSLRQTGPRPADSIVAD
jgi:hypothetical protein